MFCSYTPPARLRPNSWFRSQTVLAIALTAFATAVFLFGAAAQAQVTVNAGSGAGAFQCTEGAPPSFTAGTDVLWCDASHWLMMNANNSANSTAIMGVTGSDADNTISLSAVDGSGNPSFLTTSTTTLTLNGATTPFVAFIDGLRVVVTTNITSSNSLTTNNFSYVYLKKDATIINTDIGITTLPPVYSKSAPTCPSGSIPQFWFDLKTRQMKSCMALGSFTANPVIFLGVVALDNSNVLLGIAHEPWRLDPYVRSREFGNGGDGVEAPTTTVTQDGWKQYSALEITSGGNLQHTQIASASTPGLVAYSQNPVLIVGTGKIDLAGLGTTGGAGGVGATTGVVGLSCGWGGGGGGGGSTGGSGAAGGARSNFYGAFTAAAAGGTTGNPGTAGASPSNVPPLNGQMLFISGCGGGGGAGGSGGNGGLGGNGGGGLYLKAPSVIVGSSATVDANGGAGGAATTFGGGGGGGGGGVIVFDTWFEESSITITAASGSGGALASTGKVGGAGGTGVVQVIQRQ